MPAIDLVTSRLSAAGRLRTVLDDNLATVLVTVPDASNPIGDLDGDTITTLLTTVTYRFGFGPTPWPDNAGAIAHIYVRNAGSGQWAVSSGTEYVRSGAGLVLGVYCQMMLNATNAHVAAVTELGATLKTARELDWYAAEVLLAGMDHTVHRYLANGVAVREPIETVLKETEYVDESGDVQAHIRIALEWSFQQDQAYPTNTDQF